MDSTVIGTAVVVLLTATLLYAMAWVAVRGLPPKWRVIARLALLVVFFGPAAWYVGR